VTWRGQEIGRLTRFRVTPGSGVYNEVTHIGAATAGSGVNVRVLKQYDCVAIEPGSVDVGLYGCPPYQDVQIGQHGTISVMASGVSISRLAYLDSFDVTGQVGDFLTGQATFRFTGEEGSV
jgi:hypothetical protein